MDLGIGGRIALVTGASSGLGEAVAMALAAEGAKVAVAARRFDRLQAVAGQARKRGAEDAGAFHLDLSEPASIDAMLGGVRSQLGEVDIVVVNSGGPKPGTYLEQKL